jgi:hypothetical protein
LLAPFYNAQNECDYLEGKMQVNIHGVNVECEIVNRYEDGKISQIFFSGSKEIWIGSTKYVFQTDYHEDEERYCQRLFGSEFILYPNGNIKSAYIGESCTVVIGKNKFDIGKDTPISFYENGNIRKCVFAKQSEKLMVGNNEFVFSDGFEWNLRNVLGYVMYRGISFHENGSVKEATINDSQIIVIGNKKYLVEAGSTITFYDNERIESAYLSGDIYSKKPYSIQFKKYCF